MIVMKGLRTFALIVIPVLVFNSCSFTTRYFSNDSIRKRKYTKGYYIDFYARNPLKTAWVEPVRPDNKEMIQNTSDEILYAGEANYYETGLADKLLYFDLGEKEQEKTDIESTELAFNVSVCDTVFFINGEKIEAKVLEINQKNIKYTKCNSQQGPLYTVLKSEIARIKYANGTEDNFHQPVVRREVQVEEKKKILTDELKDTVQYVKDEYPYKIEKPEGKRLEAMGIIGLVSGIAGFFYLPFVFGSLAMILGAASLGTISRNKDRFSGEGFATISLIAGFFGVVLYLILML